MSVCLSLKSIYWLVVFKKLQHCIIEVDAKIYIDACNGSIEDCPWPLHAICQEVKTLLSSLSFVIFYWVRRDANLVAHALAKFASRNSYFFYCNFESLPPLVKKAWLRNVVCV